VARWGTTALTAQPALASKLLDAVLNHCYRDERNNLRVIAPTLCPSCDNPLRKRSAKAPVFAARFPSNWPGATGADLECEYGGNAVLKQEPERG